MESQWSEALEAAYAGAAPRAAVVLGVTSAVLFLLPLLCAAFWRRRCGRAAAFAPLLFGAAGFLVSVRMLELGVHMVCIVWDNPVSRFLNASTPAYVLYGICMAGVFEECGRYVVLRFLMKKNRTRESFVMYGIGHGGIEVWAVTLLAVASLLAVAAVLAAQGTAGVLRLMGVPDGQGEALAASVSAVVSSAAGYTPFAGAVAVLERAGAMLLHISLTVAVGYGVVKNEKKYLLGAVLLHAAGDVLPALYQRGAANLWATELWVILWAALAAVWAARLYRRMGERPDGAQRKEE